MARDQVKVHRGSHASLPILSEGEEGYTLDRGQKYIGTQNGNKRIGVHWHDVKGYGAMGDGVANDTLAFQNAIDACENGGVVYVPSGDYNLNQINLKSNIKLISDGATLKALSSVLLNLDGCGFLSLEGFNIENTISNPVDGSCILINNSAWVKLKDLNIGFNSKIYDGVTIKETNGGVQDILLENCRIFKYVNSALNIIGGSVGVINDIRLTNCWFQWLASVEGETPLLTTVGFRTSEGSLPIQAITITDTEIISGFRVIDIVARYLKVCNSFLDGFTNFNVIDLELTNTWLSGSKLNGSAVDAHVIGGENVKVSNSVFNPGDVDDTKATIALNSKYVKFNGSTICGNAKTMVRVDGGEDVVFKNCEIGEYHNLGNVQGAETGFDIGSLFVDAIKIMECAFRFVETPITGGDNATLKLFQNNKGYNPIGLIASTVPASEADFKNTYGVPIQVLVAGGSGVSLYLDGQVTGQSGGIIRLTPNQILTPVYTSAPTTWNVIGE